MFLHAEEVQGHHYLPVSLGGSDNFNNLRILHADVHRLVHATRGQTMEELMKRLDLSSEMLHKVNRYRKKSNLKLIEITS